MRSVTARRRAEISAIVARLAPSQREDMVQALQAFGDAAGETADAAWLPGWSDE